MQHFDDIVWNFNSRKHFKKNFIVNYLKKNLQTSWFPFGEDFRSLWRYLKQQESNNNRCSTITYIPMKTWTKKLRVSNLFKLSNSMRNTRKIRIIEKFCQREWKWQEYFFLNKSPHPGMNFGSRKNHNKTNKMKLIITITSAYLW